MFCEKKKSKCPKKNFQSVKKGEKKNVSVEFRVFGKKKWNWKKSSGKKNQSVLGVGYTVSWAACWEKKKIQSHGLIEKSK